MNDPKTADQINSQVDDFLSYLHEQFPATVGHIPIENKCKDLSRILKRNIALRLLVEKWRNNAGTVSYLEEPESVFRQCAKELEEALSGL